MNPNSTFAGRLLEGARRIAGAAAAAALLLAGGMPAWGGSATLTGGSPTSNTCTIANSSTTPIIAVSATGDIFVQCTSTSSPGLLSLTQVAYSWVTTQPFPATVQRTGGSTGTASVDWAVGPNCLTTGQSTGTINFAAGDAANKAIPFTTTSTSGVCTVTLSNWQPATTQGTIASANVTIVDPNANVTFKFTSPSTAANFGGGAVSINVTREGGSNGDWVVPIMVSGSMAGVQGSGTLTASPGPLNTGGNPFLLTFSQNVMSQTLTYTPPATPPTGVTPPGTFNFALQQPTAGATVVPNQTAAIPPLPLGQPAHDLTVSVQSTCPATGSTVTKMNMPSVPSPTAQRYSVSGPVGQIISIPAPSTTYRVRTFDTTSTPTTGFGTSFGLVRCPGDTPSGTQSGPVPCKKQGGYSGNTLDIGTVANGNILFPNCYWSTAERANPWYFNIRIDYCPAGTSCNFFVQIEY